MVRGAALAGAASSRSRQRNARRCASRTHHGRVAATSRRHHGARHAARPRIPLPASRAQRRTPSRQGRSKCSQYRFFCQGPARGSLRTHPAADLAARRRAAATWTQAGFATKSLHPMGLGHVWFGAANAASAHRVHRMCEPVAAPHHASRPHAPRMPQTLIPCCAGQRCGGRGERHRARWA